MINGVQSNLLENQTILHSNKITMYNELVNIQASIGEIVVKLQELQNQMTLIQRNLSLPVETPSFSVFADQLFEAPEVPATNIDQCSLNTHYDDLSNLNFDSLPLNLFLKLT